MVFDCTFLDNTPFWISIIQPGSGGVYGGVALHLRLIGGGESRWAGKHHVLHDAFRSTATCGGLHSLFSSFKESRRARKHHVPHDAFWSTATCRCSSLFFIHLFIHFFVHFFIHFFHTFFHSFSFLSRIWPRSY